MQGVNGAKKGGLYVVGVFDEESKGDHNQIKSVADKFVNDFSELLD